MPLVASMHPDQEQRFGGACCKTTSYVTPQFFSNFISCFFFLKMGEVISSNQAHFLGSELSEEAMLS